MAEHFFELFSSIANIYYLPYPMMKRLLYTAIAAVLGVSQAYSQCTPNPSITAPGFYPDALDTAKEYEPYEMVLQFRITSDTTFEYQGQTVTADIDSVKITSVDGLPEGFGYQCSKPGCVFPSSETGCGVITGAPGEGSSGSYPLTINILIYGRIRSTPFPLTQPDKIEKFTLTVEEGVLSVKEKESRLFHAYPNPVTDVLYLDQLGSDGNTTFYTLCDISGKVLRSGSFEAGSDHQLDMSQTVSGVYLLHLSSGSRSQVLRLIRK